MKADKTIVVITVEALDIGSVPSLINNVYDQIQRGYENGTTVANDGDAVSWTTKREPVEF